MALTPQQRRRIAWLIDGYLEDEDEATFQARWDRVFAALASPEELYLFAAESHPAQEVDEWRQLLANPWCDKGTALLVFWRNSPVGHFGAEQPTSRDYGFEGYQLVYEIAERYLAGAFPFARVRFDPASFKGFSFLSRHAPAALERVPLPLRSPSPGEAVELLTPADFEWGDEFASVAGSS